MPTTRKHERRANDFGRRLDDERCDRRQTAPEAHAEIKTEETRNASNVRRGDTSEGRRRGRRLPTARKRETRASGLGRRRDDERRKRRPTAPEARAEVGSRETQNASNVVGQRAKQGKVDGVGGARRRHVILLEMKWLWGFVVHYKIALASCDVG